MRRLRGDGGTSLAEMLIATALTTVLLAVVCSTAVALQRSSRQTTARTTDQNASRVTLDAITRSLRSANPARNGVPAVVQGTERRLVFTSSVGVDPSVTGDAGAPRRYTYEVVRIDGRFDLVETVVRCDPGSSAAPTYALRTGERSRVLARNVLVEPGKPLFTYQRRNTNDDAALGTPVVDPNTDGGPLVRTLAAGDLDLVSRVTLRLRLRSPSNPAVRPTETVSTVRLSTKYFSGQP